MDQEIFHKLPTRFPKHLAAPLICPTMCWQHLVILRLSDRPNQFHSLVFLNEHICPTYYHSVVTTWQHRLHLPVCTQRLPRISSIGLDYQWIPMFTIWRSLGSLYFLNGKLETKANESNKEWKKYRLISLVTLLTETSTWNFPEGGGLTMTRSIGCRNGLPGWAKYNPPRSSLNRGIRPWIRAFD